MFVFLSTNTSYLETDAYIYLTNNNFSRGLRHVIGDVAEAGPLSSGSKDRDACILSPMCLGPTCTDRWNQNKTATVDCKHSHNALKTQRICVLESFLAALHTDMSSRSDGWSTVESLCRQRSTDAQVCPVQVLSKYICKKIRPDASLGESCSVWRRQFTQTIKASPHWLTARNLISVGQIKKQKKHEWLILQCR